MSLFWLSFCDENKPEGEQFLGVCIVESPAALDIGGAVAEAWRLGINPGGQVMSFEIPEELRERHAKHTNRLMSREALECAFGEMKTVAELEGEGVDFGDLACADCQKSLADAPSAAPGSSADATVKEMSEDERAGQEDA